MTSARRLGTAAVGAVAIVACLALAGCGDDDDPAPASDAGVEDAGPWVSGELACAADVTSDYATRTYSFADGFDRRDLGPNWHSAQTDQWVIEDESQLVVTGEAAGGPGDLAMVSDRQTGTEIVVWADVVRDEDWAGAPSILCRADGPPMTTGYGARLTADHLELFEQDGASDGTTQSVELASTLAAGDRVRLVLGCTGEVVTAFAFTVDADGAAESLACASWPSGDAPRVGAVALTQAAGRTVFDDVRIELDP